MAKDWLYRLFIIVLLMGGAGSLFAQNKAENLKTRKEALEKEIAFTNKLIQNINKNKKSTL